jgi:hypothetical protein
MHTINCLFIFIGRCSGFCNIPSDARIRQRGYEQCCDAEPTTLFQCIYESMRCR